MLVMEVVELFVVGSDDIEGGNTPEKMVIMLRYYFHSSQANRHSNLGCKSGRSEENGTGQRSLHLASMSGHHVLILVLPHLPAAQLF